MGTWQGHHSREPKSGRDLSRLCTGHKTNGQPCRRYASAGSKLCATHGSAPQILSSVERKTEGPREKLLNARELAVESLIRCILAPDSLWADRNNASRAILDRGGMPPGVKIIEEKSDKHDTSSWDTPEFRAMVEEAKQRLMLERAQAKENIRNLKEDLNGVYVPE